LVKKPLKTTMQLQTPDKLEQVKRIPRALKIFFALVIVILAGTIVTFVVLITQPERKDGETGNTHDTKTKEAGAEAGLLLSRDGGISWGIVEGSVSLEPLVAAFKEDSSRLYVGTSGQGLWLSKENSFALERILDKSGVLLDTADIYSMAQSLDGRTLYLAVFQRNRGRVIRLNESGADEIYATPLDGYGVFDIVVDPLDSKHIVLGSGDGAFLESSDGGISESWEVVSRFREGILDIVERPTTSGTLFALGSKQGIYTTESYGRSWVARPQVKVARATVSRINDIKYHNARGSLILATDIGLLESYDNGSSWIAFQSPIPPGALDINAVESHPRFGEIVWMAAGNQIYRTDNGGVSWRQIELPTKKTVSLLIVDPQNPTNIYAGLSE
jgi:photosystem II stability/assembly factor-like uncharacterized protein